MGKSKQRKTEEREGWGPILCHCQLGQDADIRGYNGRPRSSGSPQKSPKFEPALGRAGHHSCPFLIWVRPLGAGFTQTDPSDVRFWIWVPPLEMPLLVCCVQREASKSVRFMEEVT